MIQFRDVSKKFGDEISILDKVSFSIDKGSFAFLIGNTGSGKTTIFRLIIRDLFPTEGNIVIDDLDVTNLPKNKVPHLRRKVGTVFQDLKLLMDRTVIENVILPLELSGFREKEAKDKAVEVLINVGLEGKLDKFPLQLSGGERQRVAIARALVFNPEIILADEPTGNLDLQTSFQILDLLESINKKGTTVFMATHNERIIEKTDKKVMLIEKGSIVEKNNKKEVKHAS
ncbi:MAG: cell division ATP-binding protein FtsE [Candidatus Levybacteria bacterium RIFCSPHIGHO2_01_FULL_36_15]|nr:MAG: cell division ATP-binding protein FtsE [Candidatus Levybacteria bacterium RIFCSPHIGHO2_01_FULL_36_15]OGH38420.1 MAG: cell division ATP-binding protein FtsE [Candidatus Levybacteria bacterium RIFCSPLOWO2_01_FULL_36_10]